MGMSSTSQGSFAIRAQSTYNPKDVMVIVCSTLALYNTFELLALIFMTFKRYRGLYFWSIFLASFGVIPYCVGWLIVHFELTHDWVGMIIDSIGWILLVSGQSVVLYSRLHLVLNDPKILRNVLWMIIVNGVIWHTSITVLLFGSSYSPAQNRAGFNSVFNILEKVQMTCFCLQEFTLSSLYIWKTWDILKTAFGSKRRFMWQLFAINVLIVVMDIALLAIEYKSLYVWEQGVKVVTYSIKLKLEFAVLGELIEFVQHRGGTGCTGSGGQSNHNTAVFVELSGSQSQTGDRKTRSTTIRPEAIHMEDIKPSTSVTITTSKASSYPSREQDEIRVATRIDVESSVMGHGDNNSTDQLYDSAIQEISRS
ncbi:hypothetical protein BGZ61DRAFT_565168 [Ilyonectria robusta]|uniref:uncharacterized protein n=1 Tax=Ilyonectria robusta TaxID=1079257 RepID=UPI001E8EC75E|nr:uncharacterized protein BGZ61DRAFT_565168 [Ilyonectria robusta]KAH8659744.1 hypothetical protein BGZ61DRAFT_565168 [Ilyonectria robusta]